MRRLEEILQDCDKELRGSGELGISAALFDSHRGQKTEISFKADRQFPMASIVKVPIGMTLALKVANGAISFNDSVTIKSRTATPGPVLNPLDRFYFCPFDTSRTEALGRLLGFMLRYSDNTAADAVLNRLGGTSVVMEFLSRSGAEEICVTRTISELLTYYYDLQAPSFSQDDRAGILGRTCKILKTIRQIHPAYACRMSKEECLIESRVDSCIPTAMTRLLTKLWTEPQYGPVLAEMQKCRTGSNRIPKGTGKYARLVKGVAHKTGSLGAVTNDVGIVEFHSGHVAVMTVMTCKSTAPLRFRENTIASVVSALIGHWIREGQLPTTGAG